MNTFAASSRWSRSLRALVLPVLALGASCSPTEDGGSSTTGTGGAGATGGRGGTGGRGTAGSGGSQGGSGGSSAGTGGTGSGTGGASATGGATGTGGSAGGSGGAAGGGGSAGNVDAPGTGGTGGEGDAGTGTTPERGEVGGAGFPGWKFVRPIKLDTSAAGAAVMGNVANYPVAVMLTATSFDFAQAKPSGEDIRFGKSDGTPLPYAIESWDATAKVAALWVKVDMVMGNNATQSINMYWGNASAGDAGDSSKVFPTADGFLGVWHLDEDGNTTAGGYKDASQSGSHATGVSMMPGSRADGRVGKGTKLLNAMDQWVRVDDDAKKFRPDNLTASLWGRADSFPGRSGPGGYDTIYSSGEFWTMQKIGRSSSFETCMQHICAVGNMPVSTNAWYHFTLVKAGNSQRFYINGVEDASTGTGSRPDAKPLGIGNQTQYLTNAGEKRSWNGTLDEARVMNVAKDVNWVKLEFESQKEGSKFLSFGEVQMR
jgi:hypothetical protein